MRPLERLRVRALWEVILPVLVRWRGYLIWSRLGMGEDLPLEVYRQWRRWCRYPRYFLDDPTYPELKEACAGLELPILAVTSVDDAWAPPRSRDAFLLNASPRAAIERVEIGARETGAIGHMGYFRRSAQPRWEQALEWFEAGAGEEVARA
jgi:predicted alpha/beta hydrolase